MDITTEYRLLGKYQNLDLELKTYFGDMLFEPEPVLEDGLHKDQQTITEKANPRCFLI